MAISQRHLKSELKIHCLVPEMKFKLTSFKHFAYYMYCCLLCNWSIWYVLLIQSLGVKILSNTDIQVRTVILLSYLRNKSSVLVFNCRIKYRYEFECVWIKSQVQLTLSVKVATIFYNKIEHCSFPSLCIRENHGTVLE